MNIYVYIASTRSTCETRNRQHAIKLAWRTKPDEDDDDDEDDFLYRPQTHTTHIRHHSSATCFTQQTDGFRIAMELLSLSLCAHNLAQSFYNHIRATRILYPKCLCIWFVSACTCVSACVSVCVCLHTKKHART